MHVQSYRNAVLIYDGAIYLYCVCSSNLAYVAIHRSGDLGASQ